MYMLASRVQAWHYAVPPLQLGATNGIFRFRAIRAETKSPGPYSDQAERSTERKPINDPPDGLAAD